MLSRWYSIGTAFQDKSGITTFPEFALFTQITDWKAVSNNSIFKGSSLQSVVLYEHLEIINERAWYGWTAINMDEWVLPTSLKQFKSPFLYGYCGKIVIKSVLTTFTPNYCFGRSMKGSTSYTFVIDVDAVIPINGQYMTYHHYYVRDNLVDAYKADPAWSSLANRIYPISELPD